MTQEAGPETNRQIAPTGVAGLDDVLIGGFRRRRLYLVEGVPGSGKTTLALQFLIAGAQNGESVLIRHSFRNGRGAAVGRRLTWLDPRWHQDPRIAPSELRSNPTSRTRCSTRPKSSSHRPRK